MSRVDQLYRKVGRRYVPVDQRWADPAPGVWIVYHDASCRGSMRVMRLGDTPTVMTAAAFHRHVAVMASAINKQRTMTENSDWSLAEAAIRAVVMAEEAHP